MSAASSEEAWSILERTPPQDLTTRVSGVSVDAGTVVHALDAQRHRHLLLPVLETDSEVEDTKSRGVSVQTRLLIGAPDSVERRFIDVRCEEMALNDLFSTVCDEMLEQCERIPENPGLAVTTVLERWRDLLGPASRRLLGEQELKGLLAELHVLEDLAAVAPDRALLLWTGPNRARHDFTGLLAACEVKASSLADEVKIHVNGLNQLAAPPSSRLYLSVERFERVPMGGDSVPDVIDRLVENGIARHSILQGISKIGVQPADLSAYAQVRFKSQERRIYLVNQHFPRLTPDLLVGTTAADRVSNVEYVLNLSAQPPVPLGPTAVDNLADWLLEGTA
ncbi:PD-(D/E)XK motif protein [Mycobacterium paragordonae]|uniref:PD-(D/E)XK motif protein n=1 Tax=Mycobacterium paragordonae TaxID=1389713 RepID=UPI0012E22535|nr:PD-(D/E)XK motif protein [Mycobacterium paragordonae]